MKKKFSSLNKKLLSIFKAYSVRSAWVFGSYFSGNFNQLSDVDIAVLFPDSLSAKKRFNHRIKLAAECAARLGREVDLVVLNDISSIFLKYVIVKEGQLFHTTSSDNEAEYQARILSEYFDFRPFLEEYNKNYVKSHRKNYPQT